MSAGQVLTVGYVVLCVLAAIVTVIVIVRGRPQRIAEPYEPSSHVGPPQSEPFDLPPAPRSRLFDQDVD